MIFPTASNTTNFIIPDRRKSFDLMRVSQNNIGADREFESINEIPMKFEGRYEPVIKTMTY